jgi:hypothetical protein
MLKKTFVLLVAALVVAGCAPRNEQTAPTTPAGQPFLPAYLSILQGKQQPDHACHPTTLASMLVPCDHE